MALRLTDVTGCADAIHRGFGQIIPAVRRLVNDIVAHNGAVLVPVLEAVFLCGGSEAAVGSASTSVSGGGGGGGSSSSSSGGDAGGGSSGLGVVMDGERAAMDGLLAWAAKYDLPTSVFARGYARGFLMLACVG